MENQLQDFWELFMQSLADIVNSIKQDSLEPMLDRRDQSGFIDQWEAAYQEVEDAGAGISADQQQQIDEFREAVYMLAISQSGNEELAAYISDDFELICRHLLCKSSSKWIAALAAAYLDENFPIEMLDPIEITLEDLLSEEE